jgi:hypothetical protein
VIRRASTLTAVVAAAVLMTGCAAHPTASASPSAARTPTVTPLPTPGTRPAEVTRSTFGAGVLRQPTGTMPAAGQLAVDVACAGTDGSRMRWTLVAGDGTALGLSGEADCTGPPSTQWLGITADTRPARVRVRLAPASGVVSGYAIVRRGTP